MARALVQAIVDQRGLKAKVKASLNQRKAIKGADHVITTFQQGGLEAYELDIEIPRKYGVEQCGGILWDRVVSSGLSLPVLIQLGFELDDLAPEALPLNYVNPMSANSN